MSTYCIGDVQGCYDELQLLLKTLNFDRDQDTLWFVGDLVNRGPKSLAVLRFIKDLPHKQVVLGNHDLHLIMLYYGAANFSRSSLDHVLEAHDAAELILWLKNQPLFYYDRETEFCLVHAGFPPEWDLSLIMRCATEAEKALQAEDFRDFLPHLYGNEPDQWSENLHGFERLRYIINALTRIRFCTQEGKLNFTCSTNIGGQPPGYHPWYQIESRKSKDLKIIFGHWAALMGKVSDPNLFALDTGCVWGGTLTAMRLDTREKISVPCMCKP